MEQRIIAIDFDGTIVEDKYPDVGRERPFAFQTLKALQKKGFLLILWTCRAGATLEAAVDFCRQNGVEFYAVNSNYPGEPFDPDSMRKIEADIYIDDRNYGGAPQWGEIYQTLCPNAPIIPEKPKAGGLKRLFSRG